MIRNEREFREAKARLDGFREQARATRQEPEDSVKKRAQLDKAGQVSSLRGSSEVLEIPGTPYLISFETLFQAGLLATQSSAKPSFRSSEEIIAPKGSVGSFVTAEDLKLAGCLRFHRWLT